MNEFFELERKCKQLKRKKIIKFFIYILILFIILIASFGTYKYLNKKPIQKPIIKKHIQHKTTKPKPLPKLQKITKKQKIEKITSTKQPVPTLNLKINLNKITEPKPIQKKTNKPKPTPKKITPTPKIVKTKPKKLIQDETISFDKAMRLATLYYNNADYTNSMKWCKFASNIDNSDEKVWKLYALNLEKTGQRQRAIKVLKTYLKYRNSLDLKYLLQRLEK